MANMNPYSTGFHITDTLEDTLLNFVMRNRAIESQERIEDRRILENARQFDAQQKIRDWAFEQEKGKKKAFGKALKEKEKIMQNVREYEKRYQKNLNQERGPLQWLEQEVGTRVPFSRLLGLAETREEYADRVSGSAPDDFNILNHPELFEYFGPGNISLDHLMTMPQMQSADQNLLNMIIGGQR